MNDLMWLANWYTDNCDGDWEHSYGISINTLDNPGWIFKANLLGTKYEGILFSQEEVVNDDNWLVIKCDGETFEGVGDSLKLSLIISHFKNFIYSNAK